MTLQDATNIATIISSFAVLIALIQILISNNQFKRQLNLTRDQFTLQNQGYIIAEVLPSLFVGHEHIGVPMTSNTRYFQFNMSAILENGGHTPISLAIKKSILYVNGVEKVVAPLENLGKSTLYPGQRSNVGLMNYPFESGQGLLFSDITNLKITVKILIEYSDFNNKNKLKTIERTLSVIAEPTQVIGIFNEINDKI
jgi:hypothetical protein